VREKFISIKIQIQREANEQFQPETFSFF